MDIAKKISEYFAPLGKRADQKVAADASRDALDVKVDQTRKAAFAMVAQARREHTHADRIIAVAEEAIRSLRGPRKPETKNQ